MPGVFAAGDIRHGSTKRVAAAVGEGSTAAMLVSRDAAAERPASDASRAEIGRRWPRGRWRRFDHRAALQVLGTDPLDEPRGHHVGR